MSSISPEVVVIRSSSRCSSCAPPAGPARLVGCPSAAASGPGPKSVAKGVQSKYPVQLRTPPLPPPGQARSRQREAWRANSPSGCAPSRRPLRPNLNPKLASRGVELRTPSIRTPSSYAPLRYHLRARLGVSSERCRGADSRSGCAPLRLRLRLWAKRARSRRQDGWRRRRRERRRQQNRRRREQRRPLSPAPQLRPSGATTQAESERRCPAGGGPSKAEEFRFSPWHWQAVPA